MNAESSWASTPATRASMLANKRSGTKPEVALRSALHAAGYRFRKDYRIKLEKTSVRPDIVFPRVKVAIFVDGCFWHSCPLHGTTPRANADYWVPKLARNVQRDHEQAIALGSEGWLVLRIWEHVPSIEAFESVVAALEPRYAAV